MSDEELETGFEHAQLADSVAMEWADTGHSGLRLERSDFHEHLTTNLTDRFTNKVACYCCLYGCPLSYTVNSA